MTFKNFMPRLVTLMVAMSVAASEETATAEADHAQPSLYSAAYLPKPGAAADPLYHQNPYEGAVASTSTNVGPHVAAHHRTVETPFSSSHKSDVRVINDAQPYYQVATAAAGPYPAAYGPYPAAYGPGSVAYPAVPAAYGPGPAPYPAIPAAYGPGPAPYGQYPYAPAPYAPAPYAPAPYAPTPYTAVGHVKPYAYAPTVPQPYGGYASAPVVTPHSVSHASFSGPYGAHYSYKR